MPRRDLITINGHKDYGLNVFDTVGIGGANNPGDVMVVQAMFAYLRDLRLRKNYTDMWDSYDLDPNGTAGPKTLAAIREYQINHSWVLLSTDGVIHPAKYENRSINGTGEKRLMTITFLHLELWMTEYPGRDYTKEIAKKFPNVAFWIRN